MPKYFYRSPEIDDKSIKNQITEGSSGAHRFFRASGPLMQKRFTEIVDCTFAPKILIHGNPHVANYCKTSREITPSGPRAASHLGPEIRSSRLRVMRATHLDLNSYVRHSCQYVWPIIGATAAPLSSLPDRISNRFGG